jgi:hypothetical protein
MYRPCTKLENKPEAQPSDTEREIENKADTVIDAPDHDVENALPASRR